MTNIKVWVATQGDFQEIIGVFMSREAAEAKFGDIYDKEIGLEEFEVESLQSIQAEKKEDPR